MNILIVDPVCPKPYTLESLNSGGLGGTEATVLRVSQALANLGHNVGIEQRGREMPEHDSACPKLYYFKPGQADMADRVIVLRHPEGIREAKARFPRAKTYLWSHDLATNDLGPCISLLAGTNTIQVAVSNWHKTQIVETIRPHGYIGQYPIKVIYNPIADSLTPTGAPYDPYQLIFFSSPHKGLKDTLDLFQCIRRIEPRFRLLLANPGYIPIPEIQRDGVEVLGVLPHAEVLDRVGTSLCVLYPNKVFPETFGLVFAEANALEVPVLTHPLGAAREVLTDPNFQITDCRDIPKTVEKVLAWADGGRPTVKANEAFRLSRVAAQWGEMLK